MRRIGWRLRRELRIRDGVVRARIEVERKPLYSSQDTSSLPLAAVALGTRARDVEHAARRWGMNESGRAARGAPATAGASAARR
jgi:hypothetical protein